MSKILLGLLFFLVGCIEAGESDLDGNVLTRGGGIDKNRFILEWLRASITVRYMGSCFFVSGPQLQFIIWELLIQASYVIVCLLGVAVIKPMLMSGVCAVQ